MCDVFSQLRRSRGVLALLNSYVCVSDDSFTLRSVCPMVSDWGFGPQPTQKSDAGWKVVTPTCIWSMACSRQMPDGSTSAMLIMEETSVRVMRNPN